MSDTVDQSRLYPRVTSFRFRRGTLTPGQRRNWENLWPILGRDLLTSADTDGKVVEPPLDAEGWFGRTAPLILEIGSGTGISTAAMAADEPQFDVVAVEVYQPGLAQLVGLVDRGGLQNVRMIRGDAVVVLDELVEPKSLLGIRVFFPDPWPKARHHKRRFLQSGTLATMAEKLVDDGVLHIATDHADYTEWIRELLENQDTTQTHVVPLTGDSPISLARPTTKFEGRAADEGRTVTEFVLVRAEGRR
ncbi:MAG TPA: tRNA (guanosine(46)-N7)-methyltransferase TrmB [Gordonia sp. (in: high G+C Gram-positive bacteria)]|uniref:tRNA (guanosine(46)-N7)-methyltransferase TrmB n=1 Tax=unclassified Gordonia (in: high G+C Gram-positive bacteria) TaxID=2657482 RepID=UPI000FA935D6|nr:MULTISPECIES: tRNA (guanosine(46)-N7)-methyltransferase TrmB [unclassified Gordonia (in: high G+C Gram-positive bacteria)]RUP40262.1 MAG: tRNA (guanosine(46)-N7)-methyltransferase TrmB [Gordonia sp. (in: high G+C Gram-positive bacteria)]HNP56389.1 tRNA (guanosine(46)-N7)-methyltransferase TrmB [Gordonia sp. (in: high G+C Gram-positive bacteria)]HRC52829.1 tRNA (guanosine(46)-N7)-methyltransferase TrmB [Gordonia sp. (in: high G+C Gram-positive bacteria)]